MRRPLSSFARFLPPVDAYALAHPCVCSSVFVHTCCSSVHFLLAVAHSGHARVAPSNAARQKKGPLGVRGSKRWVKGLPEAPARESREHTRQQISHPGVLRACLSREEKQVHERFLPATAGTCSPLLPPSAPAGWTCCLQKRCIQAPWGRQKLGWQGASICRVAGKQSGGALGKRGEVWVGGKRGRLANGGARQTG